mmetsp:Transcript_1307/g.1880  ORF Transcript_1307/g.1880 Transcript_1307/m.1880 type:complete len:410 (-) Transcript_1307:81-1310(-)
MMLRMSSITTTSLRRLASITHAATGRDRIIRSSLSNSFPIQQSQQHQSQQAVEYYSNIIQTKVHHYSTTTPNLKIQQVNSDLSEEEAEALIQSELKKLEEEKLRKKYGDWKPGYRKKPLITARNIQDFDDEIKPSQWRPQLDKRTGALAIKLGMIPIWDEWGERHACTVLYMDSNIVMDVRTMEKDGYIAAQVGAGEYKKKNVTKPLLGHYKRCNVDEHPPYIVREFRISHEEYLPTPGTVLNARHFIPGQNVDVAGISKGKGFQGGMKRHGFAGMPATHGTSRSHRALGSTGQCQDPGRVFKGKKMAGRMGHDRVTTQNLRLVKIDRGRNLLYVKGAVPGNKGTFVEVKDSVKKPLFGTNKVEGGEDKSKFPPLPTWDAQEGVDGCLEQGHEVFMPMSDIDPFAPLEA